MKEKEQNKWEHMTVVEEKGGKLLRLTADDGYILKSRNGHKRQEVLTDPKRAEGWQAVEVEKKTKKAGK